MDQLDNSKGSSPVFQSGTHSAHAVAMAAGLATLEQLTDDAHAHLNGLGSRLKTGLDKLFGDRGVVARALARSRYDHQSAGGVGVYDCADFFYLLGRRQRGAAEFCYFHRNFP